MHLPGQGSIYPSVYYPLLKPHKAVKIAYTLIIPLKKKTTIFAFKTLLIILLTPANDFVAAAAPTGFFLS
jgi:hypothetical protein